MMGFKKNKNVVFWYNPKQENTSLKIVNSKNDYFKHCDECNKEFFSISLDFCPVCCSKLISGRNE